MTTNTHITPKSGNAKTGPIPVSTTSAKTCPKTCPFNHANEGGCYAESGPLALHWRKVTSGERGDDFEAFCAKIEALPEGQLWRHNQAGDLQGDGVEIDGPALGDLVAANRGKRGFTYTHYPLDAGHNRTALLFANVNGFTVNLSGNSPSHADTLIDALGRDAASIPVVTVLPIDAPKVSHTPKGRRIVRCPAVSNDKVSCATCGLCQRAERDYIIGFPAHGTSKAKAGRIASQ